MMAYWSTYTLRISLYDLIWGSGLSTGTTRYHIHTENFRGCIWLVHLSCLRRVCACSVCVYFVMSVGPGENHVVLFSEPWEVTDLLLMTLAIVPECRSEGLAGYVLP